MLPHQRNVIAVELSHKAEHHPRRIRCFRVEPSPLPYKTANARRQRQGAKEAFTWSEAGDLCVVTRRHHGIREHAKGGCGAVSLSGTGSVI